MPWKIFLNAQIKHLDRTTLSDMNCILDGIIIRRKASELEDITIQIIQDETEEKERTTSSASVVSETTSEPQ